MPKAVPSNTTATPTPHNVVRLPGPVTRAIAAMRADEPAHDRPSASQASRRGLLFGLAALPVAGTVNAAEHNPDAAFLALGPTLIQMLDEFDALREAIHPFYESFDKARQSVPHLSSFAEVSQWNSAIDSLPEYAAYISARRPWVRLDSYIDDLVRDHMDTPAQTLEGVLLKHRVGKSLDQFAEYALEDLDRLFNQRHTPMAA